MNPTNICLAKYLDDMRKLTGEEPVKTATRLLFKAMEALAEGECPAGTQIYPDPHDVETSIQLIDDLDLAFDDFMDNKLRIRNK